jgi:uncharacterized repeat protein (TIGR03837 family)
LLNTLRKSKSARWDIFCIVIDNYGDIGVCWRLARQLAAEHGLAVRLWVDELAALQKIEPTTQSVSEQLLAGVEVCQWLPHTDFSLIDVADVVVEAFACEVPPEYLIQMAQRAVAPHWFNLEYLTAESWAKECHGLTSIHARYGLHKVFFFPGFERGMGGLIREQHILAERDELQRDATRRAAFLHRLGVTVVPGARLISLFAYENAALPSLFRAMETGVHTIHLLVPEGRVMGDVSAYLGYVPAPGELVSCGNLHVQTLPFMAQQDYDRLLWCCDMNCVRGEDSFVRAQWAATPMLWHIYVQEDEAHLVKLQAFLDLYCVGLNAEAAAAVQGFWLAWNRGFDCQQHWQQFEQHWPELQQHARHWSAEQISHGDLAANMVQSCLNLI